MPPIIVTASTSVVLVNSSNQPIPTIYFPGVSTLGRLVTVRDSDGFVSTGNYIYLQGCNGVTFGDGLSTLSITQPYGFLTLNATSQNNYSIVNTFAFPLGSTAAYVSNVTASTMYITNTIYSRDLATFSTNTITSSNEELCFNGIPTGTVTPAQLASTTVAVEAYASNLLFINVRRLVGIGVTSSNVAGSANPVGTIIYTDNNTPFDLSDGGTAGFSNGGTDVYYGAGLWVAAGDNRGTTPTGCNTGFLQWSTDGKYWTNSISPNLNADRLRNRVYWANNRYHAVGYSIATGTSGGPYTIMHSGNGKSWVPSVGTPFQGPSQSLNYATGIAFGRGVWVTSGVQEANTTITSLLWSPDGSNWNPANTVNTWSSSPNPTAYDVVYGNGNFIALIANDIPTTNLAISTDGSNWATAGITNGGLNNEPGYLANSPDQWIVVTQNYHKFSVDNGYTWNTIQDFPAGYPFRPYYDGATWWVSVSTNTTAQSIYYSFNGSNQWNNWLTGGGFDNGGYAKSFYSIFAQSNLNLQLLSSMQGISINFATSNFSACNINANNISANAITLGTDAIITRTNFQVACIETSNATKSLWWSDDNGLTYNQALSGGFNNGANGVGYNGNGLWVAVGGYSNSVSGPNNPLSSIQWSTNGKNWNSAASGGFAWASSTICEGVDVAYANGYWIAVGCNDDSSRTILRSTDGSNWSAVGANTKFSNIGYSIASGTNALGQFMWVAVGQGSSQTNTIQYSVDNGGTWTDAASGGFTSLTARAITYGYGSGNLPTAGRWVAVGIPSSIPGVDGIQYSENGSNWQTTGSQTYMNHLSVEWNPYLSQFVATGGFNAAAGGTLNRQSTLITSQTGITWNSAQTGGFRAVAGQLGGTSVTFSDSNWLASGVSTNGVSVIASSTDGSNWIQTIAPTINTSTINQLTNGITTTTQVIGKVFISAGTILANTLNMNNGLITNVCSIRFSKIDIAGTTNTSVSLGTNAGRLNQAQDAIAIGTSAGFSNQQPNAIAIGNFAGQRSQNGIAIGQNAGSIAQQTVSIAIGQNAGYSNQAERAIAIGSNAGVTNQGAFTVAVGLQAAETTQGSLAVALGPFAGNSNQGGQAIAIGYTAGQAAQSGDSVAIGSFAGRVSQGPNAVAIGINAGNSGQASASVAIGQNAGSITQKDYSIALGFFAGYTGQATGSVAIGQSAGQSAQATQAIAIGGLAGQSSQSSRSVAIGFEAGTSAGCNAVAIGYRAGYTTINSNTIVLNATGGVVNGTLCNAFYVQPVRPNVTSNSMFYDATTGEITYGVASSGTFNSISTLSISTGRIYADYISVNSITVFGPSTLTVQGMTNLNTVNINTLSTGILYVNTISTSSFNASLSSNVTSNVTYYNTTTGQLSYGPATGGGSVSDRFSTLFTSSLVASTIQLAGPIQLNTGIVNVTPSTESVSFGAGAGATSQGTNAIAIGKQAGNQQGSYSIAMGYQAGLFNQGNYAIGMGYQCGISSQQAYAIAMGYSSGRSNQQQNTVGIGVQAGDTNQQERAIALGYGAGITTQGYSALAIGSFAGQNSQGSNSIAIGAYAGQTSQAYSSIVLNATGSTLNNTTPNSFVVKPLRSNVGPYSMYYDSNSGEISYGSNGGGGGGSVTNQFSTLFTSTLNASTIFLEGGIVKVAAGTGAIAMGTSAGTSQQTGGIAIGFLAGASQNPYAVAMGYQAGNSSQGSNSVAIGYQAGNNNQGSYTIAAGHLAGWINQSTHAIAFGVQAGYSNQDTQSVAIGYGAAINYQSPYSVAIGSFAGQNRLGTNSIAIGNLAGRNIAEIVQSNNCIILNATGIELNSPTSNSFVVKPVRPDASPANILYYNTGSGEISYGTGQNFNSSNNIAVGSNAAAGSFSVSIGSYAGNASQSSNSVAIGLYAGQTSQSSNSVSIGYYAGNNTQGINSVAIGPGAGQTVQESNAVAIGLNAGIQNQATSAIAIGPGAGQVTQQSYSIALGNQAGYTSQQSQAIAIGIQAGYTGQNGIAIGPASGSNAQQIYAVALGYAAGFDNQKTQAIAIGYFAGQTLQSNDCIAIGTQAGNNGQQNRAISIGKYSGKDFQYPEAVAIGYNAGFYGQQYNCIAIGSGAGYSNQASYSICLNASSNTLSPADSGFYVNPVRNIAGTVNMQYNTGTFELSYQSSDSNVKREIEPARNYLDDLCKLRPVTFKYISSMEGVPEKKYLGFIAQEVQQIFPSMVFEHQSTLILNDNAIPTMLVTAVQSLQSTNQGLQNQLSRQEQMLQALYSTLNINP